MPHSGRMQDRGRALSTPGRAVDAVQQRRGTARAAARLVDTGRRAADISSASTPRGSNPSSTRAQVPERLRQQARARASSTTAMAAWRRRAAPRSAAAGCLRPRRARLPPARSVSDGREASRAGTRPASQRRGHGRRANANASTRASTAASPRRGTCAGTSVDAARPAPHTASSDAGQAARHRDQRGLRQRAGAPGVAREAPSARRTAISPPPRRPPAPAAGRPRWRRPRAARATQPAAAPAAPARGAEQVLRQRRQRRPCAAGPGALRASAAAAPRWCRAPRAACSSWIRSQSRQQRRPAARRDCPTSSGHDGRQRRPDLAPRPDSGTRGRITPTTVIGVPSRTTERPTSAGSAPNCRCQRPWLITNTRGAPALSSSSVNVRPSSGARAEHVEEVAADDPALDAHRLVERRADRPELTAGMRCHRVQRAARGAHVLQVGIARPR